MKNVKIVSKPSKGPSLGPPKTDKRLGDYPSLYGTETGNNRLSSIYSRFLGFGQTVVDE